MSEAEKITKTLERFLNDRGDGDFLHVVKAFLGRSEEDQFHAFLYALISSKVFVNVVLDRGELTPPNAILMKTVEVQMAKLLQVIKSQDQKERKGPRVKQ